MGLFMISYETQLGVDNPNKITATYKQPPATWKQNREERLHHRPVTKVVADE